MYNVYLFLDVRYAPYSFAHSYSLPLPLPPLIGFVDKTGAHSAHELIASCSVVNMIMYRLNIRLTFCLPLVYYKIIALLPDVSV